MAKKCIKALLGIKRRYCFFRNLQLRVGSEAVRVGQCHFLAGGRKRCIKPRCRLFCMGSFFCFSFVFRIYVVFCLPGKLISKIIYYVSSGTLNPTLSLIQSLHNLQNVFHSIQLLVTFIVHSVAMSTACYFC